ncbi:MAG: hypothetical protein PVG47_09400, partial [Chromatiales bacterium]
RLLFGEEPQIDFTTVIRLIQTKPDEFRLDGQDKLRFFGDFEDPETRIDRIETVLNRLVA